MVNKVSEKAKKKNYLFLIGSAQLGRVIPLPVRLVRQYRPSSKTQNFALQPTLFKIKMRPRCIWKTSSGSRTFTSSAARRVKPSATDCAGSAHTTEGLNRYSRTVTQPKDQGASQVSPHPSNTSKSSKYFALRKDRRRRYNFKLSAVIIVDSLRRPTRSTPRR